MNGKHYTSLTGGYSQHASALGAVTRVSVRELPILKGLSIKRLVLAPGSLRAPHWHANATELSYCVRGEVLVSIVGNGSTFSAFRVTAGQMFVAESGALHAIENIGESEAEFIIGFRHEQPEDFALQGAFGAMTDAVLGNAYGLPASAFAAFPRTTEGAYLVGRKGPPVVPPTADEGNPHRFDIEGESAPINLGYGSAKLARSQFWPALKDIAMYSLTVTPDGMREPHWHPETAEMGYVAAGRARMTILNPDASTDTWDLAPGDVYFIPRAYPHHIEVLGGDEIRFLIFFDQPMPGDIGFRDSTTAFADPVLAATFGVTTAQLPAFPKTWADPLIVPRVNPQGRG
ncbi:MAG: cupin domain-containing protein [Rhizobiales bacterium]|nr:cupin domain-containing protein [Hyphomicrobiales bacterium]